MAGFGVSVTIMGRPLEFRALAPTDRVGPTPQPSALAQAPSDLRWLPARQARFESSTGLADFPILRPTQLLALG